MGLKFQKGHSIPLFENKDCDTTCIAAKLKQKLHYSLPVQFKFEGDNIESITYSINNGGFQVVDSQGDQITVEDEPLEEAFPSPTYKSFKISYNKQSNKNTSIAICNTLSVSQELRKNLFKQFNYNIF